MLVRDCERDRTAARSDVEHPRRFKLLDECERALDDRLRFRARHECAPVRLQRQAAEAPLPEHVRERLAPLSAPDERLERRCIDVFVFVDACARYAEDVRNEPLRVDAWRVDACCGETPLDVRERLADRHSPSARWRSSPASASVNSSSSPWRMRSSWC